MCSRPPGVTPHHPCGPLQCHSAPDISVPRTAGRSSPHLQPGALHHAGRESCVLLQGVADQRQLAQTAQRADLSRQALYAALLQVQVDQAGQPADLQAQTADICRCIRLPPALQGCSLIAWWNSLSRCARHNNSNVDECVRGASAPLSPGGLARCMPVNSIEEGVRKQGTIAFPYWKILLSTRTRNSVPVLPLSPVKQRP